jgi:hypothetical protein
VHAIYASVHPRKLSYLIDQQQPDSINNSWLSQVKIAKDRNHNFTKLAYHLNAGGLAHSQVLINDITSHSIGAKHTNMCGTLLIRGEA